MEARPAWKAGGRSATAVRLRPSPPIQPTLAMEGELAIGGQASLENWWS